MEPIVLSLERAQALEVRIADCRKLLGYAPTFADGRWLNKPATFRDLAVLPGGLHVVNTSSALSVIARNDEVFNWDAIEPFRHMQPKEIFGFYTDDKVYNSDQRFWVSKQFQSWSPYVTAVGLLAISDVLRAFHRRAGSDDVKLGGIREAFAEYKQFGGILNDQYNLLLKFLDGWAGQALEPTLQDYDYAFFAYNAIEALAGLLACRSLTVTQNGDSKKFHEVVKWGLLDDAAPIKFDELMRRGILVRGGTEFGLPGLVRVTVALPLLFTVTCVALEAYASSASRFVYSSPSVLSKANSR